MVDTSELLPTPQICDNCASFNIAYCTNDVLYGETYGKWPYIWHCSDCKAAVGCHDGTDRPMGRLASSETRKLRVRVHEAFDPIWKEGLLPRPQAYDWLARQLNIAVEECHISWFTVQQLKQAREISSQYFQANQHKIERRKEKRRDKSKRAVQRERTCINLRKASKRRR